MRKSLKVDQRAWPRLLWTVGPLMVNTLLNLNFYMYGGGVLDDCSLAYGLHSVLLIGYGREDGEEYWILRNSFGPNWGEAGHIKLSIRADCIEGRRGYTFGSDDGTELTMSAQINRRNLQHRGTGGYRPPGW